MPETWICPECKNTADECPHDEVEGLRSMLDAQRRDTAERVQRLIEHICWERFDCSREWAECDHGLARGLVAHAFPIEGPAIEAWCARAYGLQVHDAHQHIGPGRQVFQCPGRRFAT